MATGTATLRVVHKSKYDNQTFLNPSVGSLPELAPSSVRIQTTLISLSSNNIAYCANGTPLHWWSAYPVPAWIDAPFNDSDVYGIAPGWGYATILQSRIPSLKPGSLLWGFFPISTFPVDLLLQQSTQLETHYIEVSPHRAKVMSFYQRYIAVPQSLTTEDDTHIAATTALLRILWESGYLFNRYCFPIDATIPAIHPGLGRPWTAEDGDLSSSLVICLGASSKTSRSFVQDLTTRPAGTGPVAVLEVSSSTSSCFTSRTLPFKHNTTTYSDLQSSGIQDWLFSQNVSRFLIFEFASPRGTAEATANLLRSNAANIPAEVLAVGVQSKVYTAEEMGKRTEMVNRVNGIICSAPSVRAEAVKRDGEKAYFGGLEEAFQKLIEKEARLEEKKILGIQMEVKKGLQGDDGMEGAWKRICSEHIPGNEGLAFLL